MSKYWHWTEDASNGNGIWCISRMGRNFGSSQGKNAAVVSIRVCYIKWLVPHLCTTLETWTWNWCPPKLGRISLLQRWMQLQASFAASLFCKTNCLIDMCEIALLIISHFCLFYERSSSRVLIGRPRFELPQRTNNVRRFAAPLLIC